MLAQRNQATVFEISRQVGRDPVTPKRNQFVTRIRLALIRTRVVATWSRPGYAQARPGLNLAQDTETLHSTHQGQAPRGVAEEARSAQDTETPGQREISRSPSPLQKRLDPRRILKLGMGGHSRSVNSVAEEARSAQDTETRHRRMAWANCQAVAEEARSAQDTETRNTSRGCSLTQWLQKRLDPRRILKQPPGPGRPQYQTRCRRGSIRAGY